jgi:hypothetical protein
LTNMIGRDIITAVKRERDAAAYAAASRSRFHMSLCTVIVLNHTVDTVNYIAAGGNPERPGRVFARRPAVSRVFPTVISDVKGY